MVGACRAAYCADLSPPPTLCGEREVSSLGPAALQPLWEELDDVILHHDLGAASARVVEARKRGRLRVTSTFEAYVEAGSPPYHLGSPADAGARPPEAAIVITLFGDGTASVNGTKVASDDMVDAVLVRLDSKSEPHAKALIRAEGNVPYGRVIGMMDRATRANLDPGIESGIQPR